VRAADEAERSAHNYDFKVGNHPKVEYPTLTAHTLRQTDTAPQPHRHTDTDTLSHRHRYRYILRLSHRHR